MSYYKLKGEYMGLDMYLHKRQSEEIGYWRKHNRLHGFFEEMWRERNPDAQDDFNCEIGRAHV